MRGLKVANSHATRLQHVNTVWFREIYNAGGIERSMLPGDKIAMEHTGLEPVTSTLPVLRAPSCANAPNLSAVPQITA